MRNAWLATLAVVAGCSGSGDIGGAVSADGFGRAWPFTVDEGVLSCESLGPASAVTFMAPDGTEYGVNGTALSKGYPRINPIQRRGADIGPIIDRGLSLC